MAGQVQEAAQWKAATPRAAYAPEPSLPRKLARILSLDDFEEAARRHLPRPLFGYI